MYFEESKGKIEHAHFINGISGDIQGRVRPLQQRQRSHLPGCVPLAGLLQMDAEPIAGGDLLLQKILSLARPGLELFVLCTTETWKSSETLFRDTPPPVTSATIRWSERNGFVKDLGIPLRPAQG